jgi:hypothetical protein
MARQIVMDHTADSRHEFDRADAAAVAEAEKRFKKLTAPSASGVCCSRGKIGRLTLPRQG